MLDIMLKALKPLGCPCGSPIREKLVVSSMQERISEMLNHANTLIFLLGDFATLKVVTTFTSWAHLNIHKKPIGLLNVNNFYDGLVTFFNHIIKNHFIPFTMKNLFIRAPTTN